MEIEKHQELGTDSLVEGDKYLMEINLEDLENTPGEKPKVLVTSNPRGERIEQTKSAQQNLATDSKSTKKGNQHSCILIGAPV